MTTAAEIRQLAGAGAAEAQRVIFMPSSVLTSAEGVASLTREISALANRDGGRVILGVSAGGQFEDALALAPEKADATIREALAERLNPPLEASVEHIADEKGEAVVVRMLPRNGPPHRAPALDGTNEAAVFVRLGDRTRAATDQQVDWMLRVQRDPAVERSWRLSTTGGADTGVDDAVPIAATYRDVLQRAPAELIEQIARDAGARARACAELAPWTFLLDVDRAMADLDEADAVSIDDLAQPGSRSMIGSYPGGVAALLGEPVPSGLMGRLFGRGRARPCFRVPPGTEPQVDLLIHQRKGRVMLVHPTWVVTFAATPAVVEAADEGALQLELSCSLAFPEREGQIEAQRAAERIVERIEQRWSPAD